MMRITSDAAPTIIPANCPEDNPESEGFLVELKGVEPRLA